LFSRRIEGELKSRIDDPRWVESSKCARTFERKIGEASQQDDRDEHGALERAYRFRHDVPVL